MRKPNRLVGGLIALNAVTLVALVASMGGATVLPSAMAQEPPDGPKPAPFNSAEKFNQMIAQLDTVSKKLDGIEKKLSSGISVKVTEMPEVVVKDPSKKK